MKLDLQNKKIAILFAGQGAQVIGMGKEFYLNDSTIQGMYQRASHVLGYDLAKICFEENELIHQTQYTQPAILVTSCAIYNTLKNNYAFTPSVMAGFSLGEYSALHASGVFDFESILYLIKYRAKWMEENATQHKGSMAAILGLDSSILEQICTTVGNVFIANYNCPGQLVISGLEEEVTKVMELAKEQGARRAVKLNVSGAFHSKFMSEAAENIFYEVKKTPSSHPVIDVIMNCSAKKLDYFDLPNLMKRQIESSVYFEESIRYMIEKYNIDTFIEIGPGNVLSGFVRKIDSTKEVITINNLPDLGL